MPNRFIPIPGGTDPAQQLAIINKNFAELDNETVKKLYDDSTGTHSILIDATIPSIKIAKPGVDVTKATNDQLAFNSAQNVFKIVDIKTATTAAYTTPGAGANLYASNGSTVTVAHGLGYTPAVIGYVSAGAIYTQTPYLNFIVQSTTSAVWQRIYIETDATNVYIHELAMIVGATSFTGGGIPIKYYLLQETAN